MSEPPFEPPVNKLPPVLVLLFLAIAGIEAGLWLGEARVIGGPEAIGWRMTLVRDWGFSGEIFDAMLAQNRWPLEHVLRIVTYPFIHLSFTHSIFAMVMLLALGNLVARALGQGTFLAIFTVASIGGALVYALLLDDPVWLVGAYPGVYGLVGGYSYVMWRSIGAQGGQQMQAFALIAMLMGLQLVWSVFGDVGNGWVAELAGFGIGFGTCFALAPGALARLKARMRARR